MTISFIMRIVWKDKTLRGTLWSGIERFSTQGIVLVVTILMARRLGPEAFGLVAMVLVFTDIAGGIMESGFPQALVRKLDRNISDTSTAFFFNLIVGTILYGVMCLCTHPIAMLYHQSELERIIPTLSLILPLNALSVIQKVEFTAALDFQTQTKTSLIGVICGSIVGLCLTYSGFGLMAIVWLQVVRCSMECVALWFYSAWRPKWIFSRGSFRDLFGFGWKLAAAGILNTIYNNLTQLLIGYFFQPRSLGYYGRAHQFAALPANNFTLVIQRVSYPALCLIREDKKKLREAYRNFLRVAVFVIFPMMGGLAVISYPLVKWVLGEEWMFTAAMLQILVLSLMWWPVQALNLNLLQVVGRSDLFLRLEVIKKIIGVVIICITIHYGIIALCWGMVANSIITLFINTYYTGKFIDLGLLKQLRDFLPAISFTLVMSLAVWCLLPLIEHLAAKVIVGIVSGIVIYISLALIFRSKELIELRGLIKMSKAEK